MELHSGQIEWLDKAVARENVLVTGNRWGKSFASAAKLIHHAVYRLRPLKYDQAGRYRAVVASITQDQAGLIFNSCLRIMYSSELLSPLIKSVNRTPYPVITLGNGATIEARSTQNRGEYLLGNDYDLFVFDEVAFEPDPEYVVEEVIMMRLADREGKLCLVSTPNGKNWFYRRARDIINGQRPGYFQTGDSRDNPHISRDFLEERITAFSEARLKQNIQGQFVDSGGEILTGEYVDKAMSRFSEFKSVGLESSPVYLSGWDLARKQTATVGITIELIDGRCRVVALERFKKFEWEVVVEKIKIRQEAYPGRLIVDGTGLGDVVVEQLAQYNPLSVIFTGVTKPELLTNVELMHAQGRIAYERWELPDGPGRIWALEDELREARWDNNNQCDGLMALALALWPLRKKLQPVVGPRVGFV